MTEGNPYIPPELLKMLELPYGYSLLLKGDGGVGKSTLAFELLVKTKGKNATYLSTRVAPDQLFEHFPWVHDEVEHEIVVQDATQAGLTFNNPLKEEQIALKFDGMPDLLRILVEMADQATGQLFIVIDSWDALQLTFQHVQSGRQLDRPQLSEDLNYMYNVFMGLVRQKNIKLILVAENVSEMDFLVDAVVELHREFLPNNKLIRVAEIKKSRGIRIDNTSYLFTLEDGRFKAFFPWDVQLVNEIKTMPLEFSYNDKNFRMSIGTMFSDTLPLQFGSFSIEPMHPEFISLFIENLARDQLSGDNLFTVTPPANFDIMAFKEKMLAFIKDKGIDPERYYKNIKIHVSDTFPLDPVKEEENVIPISSVDGQSSIESILTRYKTAFASYIDAGGFKRAVHFGWLESLASMADNISELPREFFTLMKKGLLPATSIYIVALYSDDPFLKDLQKISLFSIELQFYRGTPLVNIASPQNPSIYGLLCPSEGGLPIKTFEIYPIV